MAAGTIDGRACGDETRHASRRLLKAGHAILLAVRKGPGQRGGWRSPVTEIHGPNGFLDETELFDCSFDGLEDLFLYSKGFGRPDTSWPANWSG